MARWLLVHPPLPGPAVLAPLAGSCAAGGTTSWSPISGRPPVAGGPEMAHLDVANHPGRLAHLLI